MASGEPFQFGAGCQHSFDGDAVKQYMAYDTLHASRNFANASAALSPELQAARQERDKAQRAERIARDALASVRREFLTLSHSLTMAAPAPAKDGKSDLEFENDYLHNQIKDLNAEVKDHRAAVNEARAKLESEKDAHVETNRSLSKVQQDLNSTKQQCDTLRNTLEETRSDLEHEKAAATDRETFLNKAYADKNDAENARKVALAARDQADYNFKEKELEFNDFLKQWHEAQDEIERLNSDLRNVERIQEEHEALEGDIERLQDVIADHARTLTVKDERITHLETLYQKERQRNLNAAAAQDAILSTPGSPVHEQAPPTFDQVLSTGDNLQDELAGLDDDEDDYDYEEPQLLDIFEPTTLFSFSPIQAATPGLAVAVNEAASVSPVDVPVPHLSLHSTEAGSVSPAAPVTPQLTVSVEQVTQFEPVSPTPPQLAVSIDQATQVEPVSPMPPQLTVSIDQATEVEPVAPVNNTNSTSMQTESAQLTTAMLPEATFDITPVEPFEVVDPPTPQLTATIVDDAAISVEPIMMPVQPAQRIPADMGLAPISVVHEERPVDVPSTKRPTSDASAQITMAVQPTFQSASQQLEPVTKKSNSFFDARNILTLALAWLCLYFYIELSQWRWANGPGYTSNYGLAGGAYGNGRTFLGFPLAQSIGNTPFSESIARLTSVWINRFEDWAGMDNTPQY